MTTWINSYRLTIFVPADHGEAFLAAIKDAIPSFLGGYDQVCWYSENGAEQYRALGTENTKTDPSIKVEISLPYDEKRLEDFVQNHVIPAHPWEEPVILVQETRIRNHDE